jgi:tetratricopeptide (TPR) repeat protein
MLRVRLYTVVLIAALFALSAPSVAEADRSRWIRVDTDHFTLFSNTTPAQTKELGRRVEQFRGALELISPNSRRSASIPTSIYLLRNDASFSSEKSWAGYFTTGTDGSYVAINVDSGEQPEEVIFHEYVHEWLERHVPDVPLWLNEGLAEYYSTFTAEAGRAEVGRYIKKHVDWLKTRPMIPISDLLLVNTSSADYHERDRVGTFYAQSWALVHYLVADRDRRNGLERYLAAIEQRKSPLVAFSEGWGLTPEQAQEELRSYIDEAKFRFHQMRLPKGSLKTSIKLKRLSDAEGHFRLGDLLAHTPPIEFDAAAQHMQAAIDADPEFAPAWATLGYLDHLRGEDERAGRRFARALELGDGDPRTHRLMAQSLLERFEATLETGFESFVKTPEILRRSRDHFEQALKIEPQHAPSVAGLARTFIYEPNSPRALPALRRAIQLLPRQNDLLLDLIVVTAHRRDIEGAQLHLDRSLRPRGEASLTRSAEAIIATTAIEQSFELDAEGDRDGAIELLGRTAQGMQNGTVRGQLLAHVQTLQIQALTGAELDLYNEAIEDANSGQMALAIAKLERIRDSKGQPGLRRAARVQLDSLVALKRQAMQITSLNEAITLANDYKFEAALQTLERLLAMEPDSDLRLDILDVKRQVESSLDVQGSTYESGGVIE